MQFCIEEILSLEHTDRILILYPYELRNEKILRDNIEKMSQVIREYIKVVEKHRNCIKTISNLIWDSQKIAIRNEANELQRRIDDLSLKINEGISPYYWCVSGRFHGEIYGIYYNVDNIVRLER